MNKASRNNISIEDVFKNMVSISELNKGKASDIIDGMKESGFKIIVKDNCPVAVLLPIEDYSILQNIKDEYIDINLEIEALRRMKNLNLDNVMSYDELV